MLLTYNKAAYTKGTTPVVGQKPNGKSQMKTLTFSIILLAATMVSVLHTEAQTDTSPSARTAGPTTLNPGKQHYGFQGTISSFDRTNMTLLVKIPATNAETKDIVVTITSATKIAKNNLPGQFSDVVAGWHVLGSYWKGVDGVRKAKYVNVITILQRNIVL
jgi:hypothetical protein